MFIMKVQPVIERYVFRRTRRRSSDHGSSGSNYGYDSTGGGSDCGWSGSGSDSGGSSGGDGGGSC
jgi:hypothetical protein